MMHSLKFEYSLTYGEAFEAFLLLAARGRKSTRNLLAVSMIVMAAMLTALFAFTPYNFAYSFLAMLLLITFGSLMYYPKIKAHLGARRVEKLGGLYKVELQDDGRVKIPDGSLLELAGDKDARAFETTTLFVLRPDRRNTFCLPKRGMTADEIDLTRSIINKHVKRFFRTNSLDERRS